jgi:hypothetical protein
LLFLGASSPKSAQRLAMHQPTSRMYSGFPWDRSLRPGFFPPSCEPPLLASQAA